ncbi:ABC transporter permease [Devosia sp.]|uniref:ABC transporter permease n=1 Tax=Devosia sp. TaxID=1871048 RepID=UPI0025FA2195|nr:ABC transporter permease [Devosia sp.]MCR6636441.1 ABC transporter permease [Devosia sp.]
MYSLLRNTRAALLYLGASPKMIAGLVILALLLLIGLVGPLFIDVRLAEPISVRTNQPPSADHWLGTDSGGRELLAVIIAGTPQTLRMGVLAGVIGTTIGVMLGLFSGYFGGWWDRIISGVTDTMLTIPPLAILLVVAASVRAVNVEMMALIIASLSWMHATRVIRAQVLTLRELGYVQMARLSGLGNFSIIFREIFPNVIPIAFASLVGATSGAILSGMGLEVLGLGPQNTPTLGMTIYWALLYAAFSRGMWWWWCPPIIILALLFIALFLIASALDDFANPRLRSQS